MTRTARRRWTRELSSEVDGIAVGESGPILLHGYDPPAGGRWIDSAIPGKLASLDRSTGEVLWVSPCEVGYGRGFGAGFGGENDAIVLGPSSQGHRIVRMSLENGELVDMGDMGTFDEAIVFADVCVCANARRIFATDTGTLNERWSYAKKGERYHHIARLGDRVFVVYSHDKIKKQGVLCLDAKTGKTTGSLIGTNQTVIHDIAVDERALVILTSDLEAALPREILLERLLESSDDDAPSADRLALLALDPMGAEDDAPLWFEAVDIASEDEFPEVAISADSGKLYVVRGALLEVRDALTGRTLGDWAIPGLDERVDWRVSQGAGLLAEETRVSVFELPA
jgi:hypothetical protein